MQELDIRIKCMLSTTGKMISGYLNILKFITIFIAHGIDTILSRLYFAIFAIKIPFTNSFNYRHKDLNSLICPYLEIHMKF